MIGRCSIATRYRGLPLAGMTLAVCLVAAESAYSAWAPTARALGLPATGSAGIVLAQAPGESAAVRLPRPRPDAPPPDTAVAEEGTSDAEVDTTGPEAETAGAEANAAPVSESAAVPLPRPRPDLTTEEAAELVADAFYYGFRPDYRLKSALDAMSAGRFADARDLAARHDDPLVSALVDWLVAREPDSGLSAEEIVAIMNSHAGWPEPERLQLQAERAFHALGPDNEAVLAFYSVTEPRTIGGKLALAGALREAGQDGKAIEIVRALWREEGLSAGQAASVLTRFGTELRREDHLFRFRRLVLTGEASEAEKQSHLLGPRHHSLARAVIAALKRDRDAPRLLRAVAPEFFADPLYVYAKARVLRRSGQPIEAARLILNMPADTELAGDGDVWWDERRDLSRTLLDRGTPDLAYRIAAGNRATGDAERTEAAFHAGWYALRFLGDPGRAHPHFRDLLALATLPRTRSRASYWLGLTYEAEGKSGAARLAYGEAARFGGTFYGQLAREKLGMSTTGLERTPSPSALDRLHFAERDGVRAIRMLAAAGHGERAFPFFRVLAETIETPGEVALLTALARRIGQPHAGTAAAAVAEQRGLAVASLPAPFLGVPVGLPLPESVDRPLVYAVVRQESAFRPGAMSHAGARGLMQLMPATARATAQNVQLPFSVQRLTSDPLYNATLGAHHLGELLDRLDRSYVLTFVGYNAGPGRAWEWIETYGDPRGGAVDPVDWIERIPFDETRNYVQRVMENLQIYRSRIGHPLSLSEDLIRGGPEG
jgi:soluble lytic murein transglycosylase